MADKRTKHGMHNTPLYIKWRSMLRRCYSPKSQNYARYGGRGITVCERWHDLASFVADMAPSYAPGLELDRIDSNQPYCPENCRWATKLEQANNKRNVRLFTFQGESLSLAQWATRIGISYDTLRERVLKLGWEPQRAFTTPALSADERCQLARNARYRVTE